MLAAGFLSNLTTFTTWYSTDQTVRICSTLAVQLMLCTRLHATFYFCCTEGHNIKIIVMINPWFHTIKNIQTQRRQHSESHLS